MWSVNSDAIRIHDRERHDRIRDRSTQGVVFIGPSGISNPHLVVRDSLIGLGELLARENTQRQQGEITPSDVDAADKATHGTRLRLIEATAISRDRGKWRIENRLLHRYLTTGEILP